MMMTMVVVEEGQCELLLNDPLYPFQWPMVTHGREHSIDVAVCDLCVYYLCGCELCVFDLCV